MIVPLCPVDTARELGDWVITMAPEAPAITMDQSPYIAS